MTSKSEVVTLKVDDNNEIYAEVAQLGGEEDVSISDLHIDGAMDAVRAIAGRIHEVLVVVKPQEASVEFGVKLALKSGMLTGLLVEGSGDASFKITLKWKEPPGG